MNTKKNADSKGQRNGKSAEKNSGVKATSSKVKRKKTTKSVKSAKDASPKKSGKKKRVEPGYILPSSLCISDVGELYKGLLELEQTKDSIQINIANVDKTDASGLQILTAYCQHTRKSGIEVQWCGSSSVLSSSASLLGLSEELGI